jgi:DNA mismatch repair protein MutS
MKSVALAVMLAQIGAYVPADTAVIGIVDKIFTRIGASDDILSGQSTFMVEMIETSYLLNNMTPSSLLILDEVGRGTSTYDGIAIAWAVCEYIADQHIRCIFATHYHELNALETSYSHIANYQMAIEYIDPETSDKGGLVFLRKVIAGGATNSYGIEVARMAGIPQRVLTRADSIMRRIDQSPLKSKKQSLLDECIEQIKLL